MEPDYSIHPLLVYTHVVSGGVGLLSGAAAMLLRKGSRWHIKVGNGYFFSMLIMSAIGAYGAYFLPEMISVVVGALTFYLVLTAWLTVRPVESKMSWPLLAACILVIIISAAGYYFGFEAWTHEDGTKDGFAYGFYFFFGSVALVAGILDARVLLQGGIYGKHRLLRHLGRMGFSFLIAAASLFLGQLQVFPESIRKPQFLMIPVLIIPVSLLFWVVRVTVLRRFSSA
ncbi:MAG: hypothetical protein AB7K37_13065 [Cyclobacteriaceae bacterium]